MTQLSGKAVRLTGAALIGVGLAAAGSSTASAATVVTPVYGMTCYTATTGSFGNYGGHATCYTPDIAKWKVRLDCSFGGTYDSIIVITDASDGWYTLTVPQTCYFGVNSVSVLEMR